MPSESDDSILSLDALARAWAAQSGWEMLAVILAIAYLLLVVRQNPWCWAAALISTAIYTVLFRDVSLLMQSALNAYYMGMAVYGWWHWRHGGQDDQAVVIVRWPLSLHALSIALILIAAGVSGHLLDRYTEAALPYLDALVTWAAVLTTFMVARKVLENWIYWWMINSLAIVLFIDRGLVLTAALHAAYLMIAIVGWRQWLRDYRAGLASS
ncbi:nicotinamide mononucleotide transporter [Leptolyngbya valderiana BDU 20041]|nr:nicotinamide mononucleotide transporter [Leptolyngbya valderiana BDU 20041]